MVEKVMIVLELSGCLQMCLEAWSVHMSHYHLVLVPNVVVVVRTYFVTVVLDHKIAALFQWEEQLRSLGPEDLLQRHISVGTSGSSC